MSNKEAQGTKTTAEAAVKAGFTGKQIAIVVVLVVVIAALAVTIYMLTRPDEPDNVMTPRNYAQIQNDVNTQVKEGMFQTHMNTYWEFPDGSSPSSNAVVGNSAANQYELYFVLTLDETGETLMESGLLPLGTQISEVVLDRDLPKGTYPATCTFHLVKDDGTEVESNIAFDVTLEVKS